jgi:membrane fusion protein, multidrug efflux system
MSLMHKQTLFFLAGLVLVAGGVGFAVLNSSSTAPAPVADAAGGAIPVLAAEVSRKDVPIYLDGLGKVQALKTVTVRAQVEGKIVKVAFQEGQEVRAGDTLIEIDPRTYQAALDQALAKQTQDQAQLDYARKVLDRDSGLFGKKILDRQSLDQQQSATAQLEALVKADEAAIANARVQLEFTKITSPIDGRVGLRLIDEGNIVHANDQTGLAIITQVQPISIVFTLPENDLPSVNKRTKDAQQTSPIVIAMDRANGQVLDQGELSAVDNQIDEKTGTIKLKALFKNERLDLWPGQFVNARLLVDTRTQALVIPSTAINQGPSGDFVYVVRPDLTVDARKVKAGGTEGGQTLIESGLSEGEKAVVDGQYLLKQNARVSLKN